MLLDGIDVNFSLNIIFCLIMQTVYDGQKLCFASEKLKLGKDARFSGTVKVPEFPDIPGNKDERTVRFLIAYTQPVDMGAASDYIRQGHTGNRPVDVCSVVNTVLSKAY